jgi:hypothetical protein
MGRLAVTLELPTPDQIESLDGDDHDALLVELERVRRRVEAAIVDVIDRADRNARFLEDDHRNSAAWVRAVTNCSAAESRARVRTVRALRDLPTTRQMLRDAAVGVDQVREISRLHANPRCTEQVPASEQILLDAARELQHADFAIVTNRWLAMADPDGSHRDHAAADAARDFTIHDNATGFTIRGECGVIPGTAVREMWQRFCDAEFMTDWEAGRAQHGDAMAAHLLPRTAAQRRFDAFFAMLEAGATSRGDGRMADPVVNVIVDLDTFEQHLREQVDGTRPVIDPASILDRRCETTDGVPVDPQHVVALAVIGRVRRIVLDADGVIVDAGRLTRLFRGPLRDVLQAIDPRCRWLGCTIRARISALDHRDEFAAGGRTDAANAWVLCERHNLAKSKRGYTARRHESGWWLIQRPDGTPMQPPDAA